MQTKIDSKISEEIFQWPIGFYSDATAAGIKPGKKDMGWIYSQSPASAAGVYTTNQFQAAPTALTKETINTSHKLQALIMNSGIANSCTGVQGQKDALAMQKMAAKGLSIDPSLVGVASTGVIGEFLPVDLLSKAVTKLKLTDSTDLTKAILTTDKRPKTITIKMQIGQTQVTMTGFCKGSGMINPRLATMLGFITTDAKIDGELLQKTLSAGVDDTFNQITVDGDTSTNDMVVVMANGEAKNPAIQQGSEDYETFTTGLNKVLSHLAQAIAGDGEGSTKLVQADVTGAKSHFDAQKAAKAVVGSNLVKAMIFGADANWGRVLAAIGKTDVDLDVDGVSISINGYPMVKNSQALAIDETPISESLKNPKVEIHVDLGVGNESGTAWGCDLTYKYVQINASYRS